MQDAANKYLPLKLAYVCQRYAIDKADFSCDSPTVTLAVSRLDVPGAPGKPDVTSVTRSAITITWTPPISSGGSPITNYILEKRESFAVRWVPATKKAIHNTTFVVDGLKENTQFEFRVIAENKAGQGPPSDSTGQVIAKDAFSKYEIHLRQNVHFALRLI